MMAMFVDLLTDHLYHHQNEITFPRELSSSFFHLSVSLHPFKEEINLNNFTECKPTAEGKISSL